MTDEMLAEAEANGTAETRAAVATERKRRLEVAEWSRKVEQDMEQDMKKMKVSDELNQQEREEEEMKEFIAELNRQEMKKREEQR